MQLCAVRTWLARCASPGSAIHAPLRICYTRSRRPGPNYSSQWRAAYSQGVATAPAANPPDWQCQPGTALHSDDDGDLRTHRYKRLQLDSQSHHPVKHQWLSQARQRHAPKPKPQRRHRVDPAAYLLYALQRTKCTDVLSIGRATVANPFRRTSVSYMSLPAILARYILVRASSNENDEALKLEYRHSSASSFLAKDDEYLMANGYTLRDLREWAQAISENDNYMVVKDLFGHPRTNDRCPPLFVLTFVLKRSWLPARTLQVLLRYARTLVGTSRNERPEPPIAQSRQAEVQTSTAELGVCDTVDMVDNLDHNQALGSSTAYIVILRLLDHVRNTWPLALSSITDAMSMILRQGFPDEPSRIANTGLRLRRHSSFFNRALQVLAMRVSKQHFATSMHREMALFELLDAMIGHNPALRISQAGYKAVVRVLLARPKTERERDWTSLQAKSWPPWKINRTGLDEWKDASYGASRAIVAIRRMTEAGYPSGQWGRIARIYAGRDVDGSPTIQTRTIIDRLGKQNSTAQLWQARIEATRTIREAYACFLSYKKAEVDLDQLVFGAMIRKLLLGVKLNVNANSSISASNSLNVAVGHEADLRSEVQPGDTIEPFPEPISPLDVTYLPTDPPAAMDLFKEMLDAGIRPSHQTMAMLVRFARDIEEGITFLDVAGGPYSDWGRTLVSGPHLSFDALATLPLELVNAFIMLLCRLPRARFHVVIPTTQTKEYDPRVSQILHLRWRSPTMHAIEILSLMQTRQQTLWVAVLGALGDEESRLVHGGAKSSQSVLKLHHMQRVLNTMHRRGLELDMSCFRCLCVGIENATLAQSQTCNSDGFDTASPSWTSVMSQLVDLAVQGFAAHATFADVHNDANDLASHASRFLRQLFQHLVRGDNVATEVAQEGQVDSHSMPMLLAVPNLAELHAYVRVLGVLGDHEGIWSLVQWMAEHHQALWTRVAEERGGPRRWSQLMTSIRLFLECPEKDAKITRAGTTDRAIPASGELVALVREKLETIPSEESSWPDDAALAHYVAKGEA